MWNMLKDNGEEISLIAAVSGVLKVSYCETVEPK
jgi:hypothetical protein